MYIPFGQRSEKSHIFFLKITSTCTLNSSYSTVTLNFQSDIYIITTIQPGLLFHQIKNLCKSKSDDVLVIFSKKKK